MLLVIGGAIVSLVACTLWTWISLKFYSRIDTPWVYFIPVGISWWMGIVAVIVILPLDITSSTGVSSTALQMLWKINYWITFAWCWVVCPIAMEYYASGYFTRKGRFTDSLRLNLKFYIMCCVVLVFVGCFIAFRESFAADKISGFFIAAANCYGMFLIVVMVGYGLVDLPRMAWNKSNPERLLSLYYANAPIAESVFIDAQCELQEVIHKINVLPSRDIPDEYYEIVETKAARFEEVLLSEFASSRRRQTSSSFDEEFDVANGIATLAQLHYQLKRAAEQLLRAEYDWQKLLERTRELEHELSNLLHSEPYRRISVDHELEEEDASSSRIAPYPCLSIRTRWKIVGALLMCLSAILLWNECISTVTTQFSLFAFMTLELSGVSLFVCSTIALVYMTCCTYRALFKFKLMDSIALHGNNQTDAYALLKNACYIGRLQFSLAINYTNMLDKSSTSTLAFYTIVGDLDVVPFLGTSFNNILVFLILVIATCTFFNALDRIVMQMGVEVHVEPESVSSAYKVPQDKIDTGRNLVTRYREREARRNQRTTEQQLRTEPQYYSMRVFSPGGSSQQT